MREWLVTNGLGGYASLTHSMQPTSKFHGLLITSQDPPTQRWLHLTNILTSVETPSGTYDLTHYKPRYTYSYLPTLTYTLPDATIHLSMFMPREHNTTILKIDVETDNQVILYHTPVINSRHIYDTAKHSDYSIQQKHQLGHLTITTSNNDKTLTIFMPDCNYRPNEQWHQYDYQKDRSRNDSHLDYNIHLGTFTKYARNSITYYITATVEEDYTHEPEYLYLDTLERHKTIARHSKLPKEYYNLVLGTDHYITKKSNEGTTIVAGYPWFADWGRDSLIALPGLTLVTNRYHEGRDILKSFASYCKGGLIPNVFSERDGAAAYNTVDASLWYIERIGQYLKYTDDKDTLDELWPTLTQIIDGYQNGTDYNIHMDTDYLISHDPGLTWMDVKMGDYYPTPRCHKAVEIQALWYHDLVSMGIFAQLLGKDDPYTPLSKKVSESFNNQYTEHYDVIDTRDTSCRCNKIFLVSLDHTMIPQSMQQEIVADVQEKLVTPFGLRTLSKDHPDYKGYYLGDYNRDLTYHNGITWPWPHGSFITAYVKTRGRTEEARAQAKEQFLQPLLDVYGEHWDGSIHEIFDSEPPFAPHGCIAQAWSTSEILRALVEDIDDKRPPYEEHYLNILTKQLR